MKSEEKSKRKSILQESSKRRLRRNTSSLVEEEDLIEFQAQMSQKEKSSTGRIVRGILNSQTSNE